MTRIYKMAGMAILALALFVPAASARPGVFIGVGPGWYGPAYYGWYGPGPYYYGGPYYGAAYVGPNAGKVKFDTKMKDAGVFVDGGYAGTVRQLGTFPLKAGNHSIELRNPAGQTIFQQQVDVLAGKTIKLAA